MALHLRDTDHGYRDLLARVFGLRSRANVDVGILDAGEEHGEGAVTVLQVAAFNEFGTATIPERSFIRAWFDEHEGELRKEFAALMRNVVEGKRTREQILELLGQRCVGQIQQRIAAGISPANAPSTVRRKGSSTPLIDTGVLRSSISYRVKEG